LQQATTNKSQESIIGVACKVCQRRFNSFNSYNNHLKSKKHKDAEKRELENVKSKLEESKQAHTDKCEYFLVQIVNLRLLTRKDTWQHLVFSDHER